MSSYPVFSGSPFATNTNQLTVNLNPNLNIPSPVNSFQPNLNMSFLSFPPPSLPGSHHVFQNGPRFPGASNIVQPGIFAANVSANPGIVANVATGAMISPAAFTPNITLAALTSVPPPPISPHVTPFGHIQSQNIPNGALNFANAGGFPGNFQHTPQKFDRQSLNPWATTSPNGLQKSSPANSFHPWASKESSNFQSGINQSNDDFNKNSVNPWRSNSTRSNKFQSTPQHIKKSPSKFMQSKSPASDINPWAQPPIFTAESNTFQLSNEYGGQNHQNYNNNAFDKPNFHHGRGNSRNFSNNRNNNYQRQEKYFKSGPNFKREPDESKPHSCDTCDRSFPSEYEMQEHLAQHTKCNFKNCQFEAHPKVVALHKKMQHDTGYADVINNLKNSDEIEKWRAERRKRFPTFANIQKRKAEQAEKEARGEVIENKDFGKFKKQNTGQKNQRGFSNRKRSRHNRNNRFCPKEETIADSSSESDTDSHIKLRKFGGVLATENTDVLNPISKIQRSTENFVEPLEDIPLEVTSTDEILENVKDNYVEMEDKDRKGFASSNPINIESSDDSPLEISFVKRGSNGNHADESDDESPIEIPISKVPLIDTSKSNAAMSNRSSIDALKCYSDSDDDSPIEIPVSKVAIDQLSNSTSTIVKSIPPVDTKKEEDNTNAQVGRNSSKNESRKRNANNRKNEPRFEDPVRKSSLLEKLLADDIRHERNVIMQCIRHVVKKKFFGIGSSV